MAVTVHGLNTSYSKGCRCNECRAAHRAVQAKWRIRIGMTPKPRGIHGTKWRYYRGKCRCPMCVAWYKANVHRPHGPKEVIRACDLDRFRRVCTYADNWGISLKQAVKELGSFPQVSVH